MADEPLRMVVIGDSVCFTDDVGPQLPGHPGVWPTMVREDVRRATGREVELSVLARPGLMVRDAWKMLTKDRHVQFEVLPRADLVVLALGSFDNAPRGTPAVLDSLVPHIPWDVPRHRARRLLNLAYPWVVRAHGGRLPRTSPEEFDRVYTRVLVQVRALAHEAAMVALGPTSHRADFYAHVHRCHDANEQRQGRLAADQGYPYVPVWPEVVEFADKLNDDGVHWPAAGHRRVADRVSARLLDQLNGELERPGPLPGQLELMAQLEAEGACIA